MNYLLFSKKHRAWWRRNGAGYTTVLTSAGRFDWSEAAAAINRPCTPTRRISETDLPKYEGMTCDQIAEALP